MVNKEEKIFVNIPVINLLRETLEELATPTFCSYCGAGHLDLTVDIIRVDEEELHNEDSGIEYVEYDVEYQVVCDKCGKNFYVQPYETKGLIKEIK